MDIFGRIKTDHDTIRDLLDRVQDVPEGDRETRKTLYAELQRELWGHHKVEETVFYSAIRDSREARAEALEGLNEHQIIDNLLDQLNAMPVDNVAWTAKLQVLGETVRHHLDEEEEELFEEAREAIHDDLRAERLGQDFDRRKAKAMEALAPLRT